MVPHSKSTYPFSIALESRDESIWTCAVDHHCWQEYREIIYPPNTWFVWSVWNKWLNMCVTSMDVVAIIQWYTHNTKINWPPVNSTNIFFFGAGYEWHEKIDRWLWRMVAIRIIHMLKTEKQPKQTGLGTVLELFIVLNALFFPLNCISV